MGLQCARRGGSGIVPYEAQALMTDGTTGTFGERLRRLRIGAGLTQEALADRSGVSAEAIAALETGRRRTPRRETVEMLVRGLDLAEEEREQLAAALPDRRRPRSPEGAVAGPAPAASALVGREHELAEVCALLGGREVRLLTLVGTPGVGKTRLALEAMRRVGAGLPGGAVLVDLAPLAGPALVGFAIEQALGVHQEGRDQLVDRLCRHLRDQRILLVLDNVEHVLAAAPLVGELLDRCPGLQVLATSRAALRLQREQQLPVLPLQPRDAMALFVQRARARSPLLSLSRDDEAAVLEICRRLDGLPLALELAAPWLRLLEPAALLARLESRLGMLLDGDRDLPERQQTMRTTLAWSHGLLGREEQVLFRRLSTFAGGAAFDSVHAVCRPDLPAERLLLLVARLVDQSLVRREEDSRGLRIRMLEVIREYGREQLDASGEAEAVRRAHADHFRALAAEAESRLVGLEQREWLERIERELDNLRMAIGWAEDAGDPELALDLAAPIWRFWDRRGRISEGLAWLERGLAGADPVAPATRARALHAAGSLSWRLGDVETARRHCELGLGIYRLLDDRAGTAATLDALAAIHWRHGESGRAAARCDEALSLRRELGDRQALAYSLANRALLCTEMGEERRGMLLLGEALELARALGDGTGIGGILNQMAILAMREGRAADAIPWMEEAVEILREVGDIAFLTKTLHTQGCVALATRRVELAETCFRECMRMRVDQCWDPAEVANCLDGLAEAALLRGCPEVAARLWGAVATAWGDATPASLRWRAAERDRAVAEARAALGEERFARCWEEGRALAPGVAVTEALAGTALTTGPA